MTLLNAGFGRLKILIVDPSETVRQLLQSIFAGHHDVALAETDEQGYALARTLQPDVVVADHGPHASGTVLCARLREDPALEDVPFVLTTTYANHSCPLERFQAGCDQVVYKPFKCTEICAAIETALQRNDAVRKVHVLYRTGTYGYVAPEQLDALISSRQITCFRRGKGLAVVGRDALRSLRRESATFVGQERRQGAI